MLQFRLTIDSTGNEAFGERQDLDTGKTSIDATEVCRLLRLTATRLDLHRLTAGDHGSLLDYNGAKVGSWRVG